MQENYFKLEPEHSAPDESYSSHNDMMSGGQQHNHRDIDEIAELLEEQCES